MLESAVEIHFFPFNSLSTLSILDSSHTEIAQFPHKSCSSIIGGITENQDVGRFQIHMIAHHILLIRPRHLIMKKIQSLGKPLRRQYYRCFFVHSAASGRMIFCHVIAEITYRTRHEKTISIGTDTKTSVITQNIFAFPSWSLQNCLHHVALLFTVELRGGYIILTSNVHSHSVQGSMSRILEMALG